MSTLTNRLLGAASLNPASYEEVESDHGASLQAVGIVILSSIGFAIGIGFKHIEEIAVVVVAATVAWIIWVLLTLLIGTQLFPGRQTVSDFGQILRTTGFSATPGIFRAFGITPGIGWILFAAATVWMLFSFVVAVRQALDYESTGRALLVCVLGWLIHAVLLFGFIFTAM